MPIGKIETFEMGEHNWGTYIRRIKQFIALNAIEANLHVAMLVTHVGAKCYELMCDLCAPTPPEEKTFDELVDIVKNHLEPQRSEIAERHIFRQRQQQRGESISDYLQGLKHLAKTCEFKQTLEENLRDQFVSGLHSEEMRSRLFAEKNIDYKRAVELALALEAAERHAVAATRVSSEDGCKGDAEDRLLRYGASKARGSLGEPLAQGPCARCGKRHATAKCRYKAYTCDRCGVKGHLKVMCHKSESGHSVNGSWGLPAFMCDIYIAMDVTSSTSSIFNLVAISIDRYIAVTQPIKYAKHKNNKRVWFTIVLVWLISAAIGLPIVLGLNDTPDRNFNECLFNSQNYVIYSSLGSFYIPCIMMMFLYYNIFKALRNRAKKQRAAKKPPISGDPTTGGTTAVVIENVAQTRKLAETALHDDRPTNTGSGSNEDEHEDSFDKRSADLEADADDCHVIPNDKSTEFMLATVAEESVNSTKSTKVASLHDPNGNNDSGYAPSNVEDTIREHTSPPLSPLIKHDDVNCRENGSKGWRKNGKSKDDLRNTSIAIRSDEDHETSHFDGRDGSTSSKKDRKASAATARFTIYKANKASKKKREKSSAKKERKATKTLAIVLGVFLFCWAPFFTCSVLDAICGKLDLPYSPGVTVFILTTWLGYINSFLNPVIYTIFNPEFRKAFRKILHCGT